MASDHNGKLALVTGASSGIGREVAVLLAGRGYRTVVVARRTDRLDELATSLSRHAPCHALAMDLADLQAIGPALDQVQSEHGDVDVLVNAAGQGLLRPFLEQGPDDLEYQMRLHYTAPAAIIRQLLPAMVEHGRGHVINIASIAAKIGPWGHSTYAAAKAALVALTQSLHAEYGEQGVHFSFVNPGIIATEFFANPSYESMATQVKKHATCPLAAAKRIVGLLDRPRLELVIPRHYRVLDLLKLCAPSVVHGSIARQSRPQGTTGTDGKDTEPTDPATEPTP